MKMPRSAPTFAVSSPDVESAMAGGRQLVSEADIGTRRHKTAMNQRTCQNDLATFLAYLKFCRRHLAYHSCLANQLRIFDWIDERRIEMRAEGRPHWVPSTRDFEQAERDCWDDLVKPEVQ